MIKLNKENPRKSLNKAFLKIKPQRNDIEKFKKNLIDVLDKINENESEEYHKNLVSDFLKNTYYSPEHFINTKGRNDLVIHNGKDAKSTVGVIIEAKKPSNKPEMLSPENINVKAFHELILYYLRERITLKNLEIKYLVATNIFEWYIFDASLFEKLFAQNKRLIQKFTDFEEGRLSGKDTAFFYKSIAEPFVKELESEISFTYFNIREYNAPLRNNDKNDDNKLISLFKLLSPQHLLKLPFLNDSNSLDKTFYSELLHIIGLEETKDGSKKLIGRKDKNRYSGTFIESAIMQIDTLDKISRLNNPSQYGDTKDIRLYNVALELVITWINRILFLKLLEAQLVTYHKGDKNFQFLNIEKIKDFDELNTLFFQVLARKYNERNDEINKHFPNVPYLNSSLFEPTEIEHQAIFISSLRSENKIPILSNTVLKDHNGKRRSGELNALEYIFEFLNAYDFSSEGSEEIQEENKTLINASVLGLIFEKINGYKDGSFFTPGFITMYMCRETIRRAILQKFRDEKSWECNDLTELHNKITDKQEANKIINSLKICDPAVGSGHFLVSALNEIIAVKSELKILYDSNGKSLKDYAVEVVNDELAITDEDGKAFVYNPNNDESRRVQETLFLEKQTIIENCLFGVDINPNSVKICSLRLWIELLKNAYYKAPDFKELETLPNIDINIKCGNSLISRYELDSDIKKALKKSKWSIDSYRLAVMSYRNAKSKEEKHDLVKLIEKIKNDFESEVASNDKRFLKLNKIKGELVALTTQTTMFERSKAEKTEWNKKIKTLTAEIKKLEDIIEQIKSNKIYENAFEWRFEFPEVLNDDGDFVGFDVVIGNPPYIRQEAFSEIKTYLKDNFVVYNSIADILTYFVEQGYKILKSNGIFQFIISNKFTRANYGKEIRKFLVGETKLTHFIDFSGLPVFDEATVDAAILGYIKNIKEQNQFVYANIIKEEFRINEFENYISGIKKYFSQNELNQNTWAFENEVVLKIKRKVESQGIPLKDWDITINYGVKTGCNEAFIIDDNKKSDLTIADKTSEKIIVPLLRGRDIQKYFPEYQNLWLIATFPSLKLRIEEYPTINFWLKSFGRKLEQSGETGSRKKTNNNWFETQDNIAYWKEFYLPKIIYPNMTKYMPFVIDIDEHYFHNDKSFHIIAERIYWLGAFLNSKLFKYCFKDNFPELLGGTRELRKVFFEPIPVKQISEEQEKPFKELISQIISLKKSDSSTDTTALESEIDRMVYKLYELTEDEIAIIENS
ncbi:MAG TPA: Eco57I restriction-modification methylase domain-containing protein [Bacteroidales bacterium]|nr:Eco57I restriction-modification methylase domain-containing protein [Bacteroidales bacterium]HPS16901.1 Eco57I restriction-modification methylase domain-containing protein [Bacteroidales bacterium]